MFSHSLLREKLSMLSNNQPIRSDEGQGNTVKLINQNVFFMILILLENECSVVVEGCHYEELQKNYSAQYNFISASLQIIF